VPELTVEEGGAELLDVVQPLWLSMFEWHRSLPPEATSAVAARPAAEALELRFHRFRRELGEGKVILFLLRDADQAVAFAMIRVRPEGEASFETGDGAVEVDAMAVDPAYREQGLGSLLLTRVHEWAAERGIGFVTLSVMAGNEEAERFYRRFGMVRSVVRMIGPVRQAAEGESGSSQDEPGAVSSRERT
jgi:ribosomal protein S18 acetylase RimI-like enzyme